MLNYLLSVQEPVTRSYRNILFTKDGYKQVSAYGVLVGVLFLKQVDRKFIQWVLGVTLIVYSLYSLLGAAQVREIAKRWAYFFGFLAGCLGAATGASGPPVIVYVSFQPWGKEQKKATLQGFFVLAMSVVVISHVLTGIISALVLRLYVAGVPMLVIGTYLGSLLYGKIGESTYRKTVLILLALMGIIMICRA